ncbi:hypothetical protein [Pontimicrobium sp. IMCC45349]|uniref:hypothetical protein n=1 Tax=Pontimicrobium sp. IMCC45349 TaxID=3391574 RepID=UPI0039A21C24
MKRILLTFLFLVPLLALAQEKIDKTNGIFYKISLSTTLGINEDYTIADDDSGTLIEPSAYFINNTLGFKFDERSSIGLNFEYNWHSESGLHFFPAYLNFKYNLIDDDDSLFIRAGYGRFLNLGKTFEKGTFYKIGSGVEIFDGDSDNSILLGLDFTRKRFGFRQQDKLSSVSIFLEFCVF